MRQTSWSIKPELGLSHASGSWTAELTMGARFFTDNDDILVSRTREQDPVYTLQGHLIYRLNSGSWTALTVTHISGGQTTIDGNQNDDKQRRSRLGATFALPVDRHHSVKFYASTDLSNRFDDDFELLGIAWQYRWGDGFR